MSEDNELLERQFRGIIKQLEITSDEILGKKYCNDGINNYTGYFITFEDIVLRHKTIKNKYRKSIALNWILCSIILILLFVFVIFLIK